MVKTKQTMHKEQESGLQSAHFTAREDLGKSSQSEPQELSSLGRMYVAETQGDMEDSMTWLEDDLTKTKEREMVGIVLPRHTSVAGMVPSFIKYYWEHGMTPILLDCLMTRKGWTLAMVNKVIHNCNEVFGMNIAYMQKTQYIDELDTDEELGPLPKTKSNKQKRAEKGDKNDDEWDPDASMDTVTKGQRPYKKP